MDLVVKVKKHQLSKLGKAMRSEDDLVEDFLDMHRQIHYMAAKCFVSYVMMRFANQENKSVLNPGPLIPEWKEYYWKGQDVPIMTFDIPNNEHINFNMMRDLISQQMDVYFPKHNHINIGNFELGMWVDDGKPKPAPADLKMTWNAQRELDMMK